MKNTKALVQIKWSAGIIYRVKIVHRDLHSLLTICLHRDFTHRQFHGRVVMFKNK